jgi:hypothetical protein
MYKSYHEFADLFSKLSPYELNHLSEVLLCKLEDGLESKLYSKAAKRALSEKDIKSALTDAMREISLELYEREISEEHIKLGKAKAMMFTPQNVAA